MRGLVSVTSAAPATSSAAALAARKTSESALEQRADLCADARAVAMRAMAPVSAMIAVRSSCMMGRFGGCITLADRVIVP